LNEGKGLSTKASSRRRTEDTVIGLRYGNLDRLAYQTLHRALAYDVHRIRFYGRWHPVAEFIPDYRAYLRRRMLASFPRAPIGYLANEAYELRNRRRTGPSNAFPDR